MNRRLLGSTLAFLFLLLPFLFAQEKEPIPMESLLAGPDHAEMPWKVQFLEPILMYQQQYVLDIRTRIPAEIMDNVGNGVLHFAAKVADANGRWLPGVQYNRFEAAAKLGKTKDVECALAIYLRPGEYTVAMVVYESTTKKSNVIRNHIVVPAVPHDPLPDLNAHLPVVEFPSEFPTDELSRTDRSYGELFAIGTRTSPLPVPTKSSTRIDVVLNVSKEEAPASKGLPQRPERDPAIYLPGRSRRYDYRPERVIPHGLALARVLQTASVLSLLSPTDGCVAVSAIDPLHVRLVQPPTPAATLKWPEFSNLLDKVDQHTIDARVLQDHKGPGMFLRDYLEKLSGDSSCGNAPAEAHIVVFVSTSLNLPEFNKEMRLSDAASERARFYLFEPAIEQPYSDDVNKILKSARAHRSAFTTPEELRRQLADFVRDLTTGKK